MHKAAEGGSLDVIKFLLPMFGARVHEKDAYSYSMLHCAAQAGHCQVARYLITELKLDPKDRDKVRGCEGTALVSECKVYMHANMYACFRLCSDRSICCDKIGVTWTCSCNVYVQSCVMPSESYPSLCLLVLVW